MDIYEIIKLILSSVGGSTLALVVLTKWLGNVWANRIIEGEKARHSRELEGYKNQLEIMRTILSRYHESQFNLYNPLWKSLYELKKKGDSLWEIANIDNLNQFTAQLENTCYMVEENALLIEDEHLIELKKLMTTFWGFQIGKKKLIDLRESGEGVLEEDIKETISKNRQIREEYNHLICNIATSFKRQMRGRANE